MTISDPSSVWPRLASTSASSILFKLNRAIDKLWDMASKSFDEEKIYLEELLEEAESNKHEQAIERCQGALSLYNYIPPQFR